MKKKMIHAMEFKGKKLIDKGYVPMTKHEIRMFDKFDKEKKEGKQIFYAFEPNDLFMKLSVDVKKDRRGNIEVRIKQAKKGYCHRWGCDKKAKKNYVLCKEHLK